MLQIIGSAVLIIYGLYLFKSNPSRAITKSPEMPSNYWRDFATGFLFTFSNPLILFFIIGLFARFNFMSPEYHHYHYILGYLSIAGGALCWWFLITYFVNKVKGHFNVRSMWLINRVMASLLIIMAVIGSIHAVKNILPLQ